MAVFLAEAALLVDDLVFFVELLVGAAFLGAVVFFGAVDVPAACLALAASLTLPLTPLGRRNTPLSLPRTMALFKCVLNNVKGSLPVSGCLARITFLSVGRPRPERPSSPYEMIASMIMSSYVMLDGFLELVDFLAGALATVDLALVGAMLEKTTRQYRDGGLKRTCRSWKTRSCLGRFPFHKSAHIWPCISRARKTAFSVHECALDPISSSRVYDLSRMPVALHRDRHAGQGCFLRTVSVLSYLHCYRSTSKCGTAPIHSNLRTAGIARRAG